MKFNILGTGSYLPPTVLTNEDLSHMVETDDEWITKRVGIKERRIAADETTSMMGTKAALAALENSGLKPLDLDLILVVTMTPDHMNPGNGALIQRNIGAACPALDIAGVACTGFIFLMETASAFLSAGKYKNILLVASERISNITDYTDRSTCIIFGDGAGAMVINGEKDNLVDSELRTFGDDETICVSNVNGDCPLHTDERVTEQRTHMDGHATYKFAVTQMRELINGLMERNNLTDRDIRWVLPHQANLRIINEAKRKINIASEKFRTTIEKYGNISSACIPVLLDELNRNGELARGDLLAMAAFGGGLNSGGAILRW